jgi:hypothetical protein
MSSAQYHPLGLRQELIHCTRFYLLRGSDKVAGLEYCVANNQHYLDAFLDAALPTEKLTPVVYDWGSTLGFD